MLKHANRKDYSVIFSIFKAKDNRANLGTCLERFRKQVNMLQKVKLEGKSIKVFMFGDCEFLCAMYGISEANGNILSKISFIKK